MVSWRREYKEVQLSYPSRDEYLSSIFAKLISILFDIIIVVICTVLLYY